MLSKMKTEKSKKKNYFKKGVSSSLASFRNKDIFLVSALNGLMVLIFAIMIKIINLIGKQRISQVNTVDLTNIAFRTEEYISSMTSELKGFVMFMLFAAIAFCVLFILNWSFFQGVIYSNLSKAKFNIKFFGKFLLLNVLWLIPWFVLLFIVLFGSQVGSFVLFFYLVVLLFLHFSSILNILFVKNNKLKCIKNALKIGIVEIKNFLFPYFLVFVTYYIISRFLYFKPIPVLTVVVFVIFFSWVQVYISGVISEVKF